MRLGKMKTAPEVNFLPTWPIDSFQPKGSVMLAPARES